jgi:hypothetical protein
MIYLKTNFWVRKSGNEEMGMPAEDLITRGQLDLAQVESFMDITDLYETEKLEELGFDASYSVIQLATAIDDYVIIHNYDDLCQMWAQTRRASIYYH